MSPIIILFLTFTRVLSTDYCAENMRCNDIVNSACDCEFGPQCKSPREHAITDEIRNSLLVAHNTYREKVAAGEESRGGITMGATDMYALQYDEDLEYTAKCWNKKCIFAHDKCKITAKFRPVGQNLYISTGKPCNWDYNLNQAIQLWYEEVTNMTASCLSAFGSGCSTEKIGHFTQMVWAQTTHVGCSLVETEGPSCQITCNYGPSGNFHRDSVFKQGTPGADCKFKSEIYPNLCLLTRNQEEASESRKGIYSTYEPRDSSFKENGDEDNKNLVEMPNTSTTDPLVGQSWKKRYFIRRLNNTLSHADSLKNKQMNQIVIVFLIFASFMIL